MRVLLAEEGTRGASGVRRTRTSSRSGTYLLFAMVNDITSVGEIVTVQL